MEQRDGYARNSGNFTGITDAEFVFRNSLLVLSDRLIVYSTYRTQRKYVSKNVFETVEFEGSASLFITDFRTKQWLSDETARRDHTDAPFEGEFHLRSF